MGGLEGPPKPPGTRGRPGGAVAPLGIASRFGGLEGSRSRCAPRSGDVVAGALVLAPATAQGGSSRPGGAVALLGMLRARTGLLEDGLELGRAAERPVGRHGLESRHRAVVDVAVLAQSPLAAYSLQGP